jgi:hypothetical protein
MSGFAVILAKKKDGPWHRTVLWVQLHVGSKSDGLYSGG